MRFSPGTSQDDIIAAEKIFKDRPVVNWAPNRGNFPVRDVVNPLLTGFNLPGKEQESDTMIDNYRSLLNKLNLSKRARSR